MPDNFWATDIFESSSDGKPQKLYATIYGDTKDESRDRANAIAMILKMSQQL